MSQPSQRSVSIAGVGAICAVGNGIAQVAASVRTGLGAQRKSSILNRWREPMTLALVPEEDVEAMIKETTHYPLTAAQERLVRLGGPALREALSCLPQASTVALFLGLPERRSQEIVDSPDLARALLEQAGASVPVVQAQCFPCGRAAALVALCSAIDALTEGSLEWAVVGGADTYLHLARLAELDGEGRLLGDGVMDGFIPGEGAAFVLLTTAHNACRIGLDAPVRIVGAATASDAGHLYGSEPALGEGLSAALERLVQRTPPSKLIQRTYAGLNGEGFWAKEWGVARIRYADQFERMSTIEHPADCYGDPGAASGALLLALAERSLRRGEAGPALVWSSSDKEQRGCALLDTP